MLVDDVIDRRVRAVLSRIHDPCSIAAGRPLSVLDMGLVRGWSFDGATLSVTFCVTFAGCTMAPHFMEAAARDLAALDEVQRVETSVDTSFVWTPELMAASARTPVGEPQAWRKRARPEAPVRA